MAELRSWPDAQDAADGFVAEGPKDDDDVDVVEQRQLPFEVRLAGVTLFGGRLVGRRCATHGGGNVGVEEFQPVVPRHAGGLIREARAMQRGEQPIAAAIASEHAAGPVPAMRRGREPDDQDARVRVAEAGYRPTPVVLVTERSALVFGHDLAPLDEARAREAVDDVGRDPIKRIHTHPAKGRFVSRMPRSSRPKPPPSTTVLFVRHGQTPTTGAVLPGRAKGLHLADKGREQAEAAAGRLAGYPNVKAVYASPLERTRETAAPIAKRLGLRVSVDKGLLECDFGEWTGKQLKDLMKLPAWATVQRYPSGFRFPGGESFAEMQARIGDAVARLAAKHPGGTIVCVSHADPIKAAIASALGTHLDLFQRIVISPCSITAVTYGPMGPTVLTVNSTTGDLKAVKPS